MKRLIPILLLLAGCNQDRINTAGTSLAFVPVYAGAGVYTDIGTEAPKSTVVPGKIYLYGSYLFQIEQNEGIHIIDNTDPKKAKKLAFLKVPFCSEIAVKSGFLYTNNVNDLVVFDLTTITAPKLVNRIKDAFPLINQLYPPASNTAFQCPDATQGIVIRWEQQTVQNASCRR